MKTLVATLLLLAASTLAPAQAQPANGILQSIQNATVTRSGDDLQLTATGAKTPIEINFSACQGLGVQSERNQWWVLPISVTGAHIGANTALWVLPLDPASTDRSWHLLLHGGSLTAEKTDSGLNVTVHAQSLTLSTAEPRPHSDPFGHRFALQIDAGPQLADALAAFYWGTMLPSVVEKTLAANFPYNTGYVLSTLNVHSYAGSYPAVDHEFQIKGRLAFGSELDLDVVRRMIELQFRLMNDDPEHLYRAPCSVQPDGRREYHVRRDSQDRRTNAAMFPVTGNIEVIEEAWHYYESRKDLAWLRANIENLQHAASWVLANTDPYGRVWSDVYYEDQVIKDGRVTQAQAFAAHAFTLLAGMETQLGRKNQSARFAATSKKMAAVLIAPLPTGYWDPANQRFIDWVDRNGLAHDHIHLLANELPVTFGYATAAQAAAVRRLIDANAAEFERFPSFVAANIVAYERSEIGTAGPYDLCAAGRYWYWDAAFRQSQRQNSVLLDQLKAVAAEGAKDSYFMGERYDMDHVYYIDGKDAHGSQKYYEYPNVFAAVLIDKYLGLTIPADADLAVAPHLTGYGTVELAIPAYAVRYAYSKTGFALRNLSSKTRRFQVDLDALSFATAHLRLSSPSRTGVVGPRTMLTLAPQQEARWSPQP
jgi:hypothetical protein